MTNAPRPGLALVALPLLLLGLSCSGEDQQKLEALKTQRLALEGRLTGLKNRLTATTAQTEKARAAIPDAREQVQAVAQRLDRLYAAAGYAQAVRPIDLDRERMLRARASYRIQTSLGSGSEVLGRAAAELEAALRECAPGGGVIEPTGEFDGEGDHYRDECGCVVLERLPSVDHACEQEMEWIDLEPDWGCKVAGRKNERMLVCADQLTVNGPSEFDVPMTEAAMEADGSMLRVRAAWYDGGRIRVADYPAPAKDPYRQIDAAQYNECREEVGDNLCRQGCEAEHEPCECEDDNDIDSDADDPEEEHGEDIEVQEAEDEVAAAAARLAEAESQLELKRCLSSCDEQSNHGGEGDEGEPEWDPDGSGDPDYDALVTTARPDVLWPGVILVETLTIRGEDTEAEKTVAAETLVFTAPRTPAADAAALEALTFVMGGPDDRCPQCKPTELFVLTGDRKTRLEPAILYLQLLRGTKKLYGLFPGDRGAGSVDLEDSAVCARLVKRGDVPVPLVKHCTALTIGGDTATKARSDGGAP